MRRVSTTLVIAFAIFTLGVAVGAAAIAILLVRPPLTAAQGAATAAPTPTLLPDSAFSPIDALDQVLVNLYERVSPSVVHITSRSRAIDWFYGVVPQEGTGSGFVYDAEGRIVTNYHVVQGADEVDVLLANGRTISARIIGVDSYYDLAVLQVEPSAIDATPLEAGDSNTLRVGQTVIAIGNPFGLDRTLTTGIISALGRQVRTEQGAVIGQAIQTDAAINPGNSGGPLLDTRGRVVGINTAINSPSGGSVGIGFAVPINVIKRVVPSLIEDGQYVHPSLGAQFVELGAEVTAPESGPARGLLIVELVAGGGAQQAGLQAAQVSRRGRRYVFSGGDIITALDGKAIATRNDLLLILEENYRPGDTVTVSAYRGNQAITVSVVLGAQAATGNS